VPTSPSSAAVLIHGIGDQPPTWSQDFRQALQAELAADWDRTAVLDAYWAPLSTLSDVINPQLLPDQPQPQGLEDEMYDRVSQAYTGLLAADAGVVTSAPGLQPIDILGGITSRLPSGAAQIADVSNYIARNGVRTAIQNVLHGILGSAQAQYSGLPIVLVSHSQGTVISYDVMRAAGPNYPQLQTWITMGCPLLKYFALPLQWGRQQLGVPSGLRWLNVFDPDDIVGRQLAGAVTWASPQPQDQQISNTGAGLDAHDHWHNPQVVKIVAAEIRRLFPS
jgi:hypothetical protein